jgi:hypothetical protein
MTYDWHGEIGIAPLSLDWFAEVDRRFVESARLYATAQEPFDRIMPFDRLRRRRVLEIGNEVMCAGLPVVVADGVGCVPDLVVAGETGFTCTAVALGEPHGCKRADAALVEPGPAGVGLSR